MPSNNLIFPQFAGATTFYELSPGRVVRIFLVDAATPLFNVILDGAKFFANREQVIEQIEACERSGGHTLFAPSGQWIFDSGFEHSIDGHGRKGWVWRERLNVSA